MNLVERAWLLDLRTSEDDGYVWTDNYADALEAQHDGAKIEEVVPAEQLRGAVEALQSIDALDNGDWSLAPAVERATKWLKANGYPTTRGQ